MSTIYWTSSSTVFICVTFYVNNFNTYDLLILVFCTASHSIGYLLSWNTESADVPHIPYSRWPTVIPKMNIK